MTLRELVGDQVAGVVTGAFVGASRLPRPTTKGDRPPFVPFICSEEGADQSKPGRSVPRAPPRQHPPRTPLHPRQPPRTRQPPRRPSSVGSSTMPAASISSSVISVGAVTVTATSSGREQRHALGEREVAEVQVLVHTEARDVDRDLLRDVAGRDSTWIS